jgi:hypothetical protein
MLNTSTNKNYSVKSSAFKTIFLLLITLLICDIGWSQSYTSREGDSINPKFYVWAGVFYPNMNTSLRIDSANGPIGTEIGLENDLDLQEDLGVFRIDGLVQLTENSQLAVTYTAMKRERRFTLEKDIVFGNRTFESGSNVGYEFNVDYVGATYRYNFFNERNWNAGLSGGLRGVFINTSLDGQLNNMNFKETAKITAPAILFGVHGSAYLTPRLLARYSLEVFFLSIDDIKINILESNASVHYYIFKNVGLGLAYSTNNYRIQNVPLWGDSDGKVDFNFGGLNMYLTSRF